MYSIKYEDTKPAIFEPKNEDIKLVHQLDEMGFRMEDVLGAIDAVKCTDIHTVLNHIVSKEVDIEST